MAKQLDSTTFRELLGTPTLESQAEWGWETHYLIEEASLREYQSQLAFSLYHHHSSFDYADELSTLGFPRTAQYLHRRRSGLPQSSTTQMAHFAEIVGVEFAQWTLGYETTFVMPKRFNPNPDQSMKGVDILGISATDHPTDLLLGEAKCYATFDKRSVMKSHEHLIALSEQEASRLLLFYKELLRLEGNSEYEAMVDRVFYSDRAEINQTTLLIVINGNKPSAPFEELGELCRKSSLPNLHAVHIEVENLTMWMPRLFKDATQ